MRKALVVAMVAIFHLACTNKGVTQFQPELPLQTAPHRVGFLLADYDNWVLDECPDVVDLVYTSSRKAFTAAPSVEVVTFSDIDGRRLLGDGWDLAYIFTDAVLYPPPPPEPIAELCAKERLDYLVLLSLDSTKQGTKKSPTYSTFAKARLTSADGTVVRLVTFSSGWLAYWSKPTLRQQVEDTIPYALKDIVTLLESTNAKK